MRDLQSLIIKNDLDYGGWCFNEKRNYIHNLVINTKSHLCVEIGVYRGSSLLSFAESLELIGGVIVGIDPWSFEMSKNEISTEDEEYENWIYNEILKGQQTFDDMYSELNDIITNNNLNNVVKLIRKPSENCFIEFNKETIDVLHIDGNHNKINVCRDILLYTPLVKKNGYVIMDDSNWDNVNYCIDRFMTNNYTLVDDFGGWSVYKKI
jgi:predicted O-methyltransferase YrrM